MAFLGAIGAVAFIIGMVWLIYSAIKHKPKKVPLITIAVAFAIFIIAVVATPAPMDSKLSVLVDAEVSVRQNLTSNKYDKQLFASEYSDLKKKYKTATGEPVPDSADYYLTQSNSKKANGGVVTSGGLYIGAFKLMNTHAANKATPHKTNDTVKAMHDKYLGN